MVDNNDRLILLLWGNAKQRQALFKVLCATGADVEFDKPNASFDGRYQLIVLDYDFIDQTGQELLKELAKQEKPPPVLVVTSSKDRESFLDLLDNQVLTNLIAKTDDLSGNELVVTVQKIIKNDVFGLEKYLTWGAEIIENTITNSCEDKETQLNALEHYLDRIGCNRRLINRARSVADEFIMNAVYNAPADANGNPKYASISRAEKISLEPNEHVLFRYACDGRSFVMSVRDNFGRMERATVLAYLRKCFSKGIDQIDTKDGGAGLGLYYIFESLNQFIINLSPEYRTEMIGVMDISGSFRDFAERPKSLNIFLQERNP
ncbi:MAG: hypothetical protein A2289_10705 [Deltaproteobacteria bacterium RIFOXYA12_FULL_58_15]|nr:MAG: hypothetical protein A2289_10705 [Deltaproteobacteria bacterium RIFOXYA12_FULL_58_15]OGR15079.1 MAG: hypothetical protein A2341_01580 [Deltaproteobacteria bacterium RIFOXYB12_FULL_58_9]